MACKSKYRKMASHALYFECHCQCEMNNIELVVPVCEVSERAGRWIDGSEEEREEVEKDLGGVKVEKAWATKPSAGEDPLWKLWGLRGAEMGKQNPVDDIHKKKKKGGKQEDKSKDRK